MANAEQLLHQAQYAFQSISFGETPDNNRNARRASSLCKKIIRKYPGSMEASEAHAVLRRLGEEAYSSKMKARHIHIPQSEHHKKQSPPPLQSRAPTPRSAREKQRTFIVDDGVATLDWGALVKWIFAAPKFVLGLVIFAGIFLFGILGPFLFLPLIAFIFFTGPFRKSLKQEQREELNAFVERINAYVTKP